MNLKKLFIRTHIVLIVLLIVLSGLSILLFQNKRSVEKNNEIRLNSYSIASDLRKTSTELTRYSRTYALTGDNIWEKMYLNVLDVHNGKQPRHNGEVISYQDRLKKINLSKTEFSLLEKARLNFNDLIATEITAVKAVNGFFADGTGNFSIKGTPDINLAQTILFDQKYHNDKDKVMNAIEGFYQTFKPRIQEKEKIYNTLSYWFIILINILIILIIGIMSFSFLAIKNKIAVQFKELNNAKNTAEEKEKENRKLSVAVEQSANAIIITDDLGIIEYINPGFEKLTEYKLIDVLGKTPNILNSGKQSKDFYKELWSTIKSDEIWKGNFLNKTKSGNLFWDETTITPIKNKEGIVINYLAVKQDITEAVKSREAIKRSTTKLKIAKEEAEESNRLKTEFLNNMSHEIRTPMNGILGFSKMLLERDITEEKQTNFVNIIQNCGNQLLQIIDDILEISILETKQVKPISTEVCLNDIFFELFSIFDIKAKENKTPLFLKRGLSDKQSTILIDKTKLNKVLSNLLENAIKFTDQGTIEFGYSLKNENIEIFIKDTGIGINIEDQELIFGRFSQVENKLSKAIGGLGLGLSIAKENTELLGGEILVVSKKGKGATFLFTIPYNPIFKDQEEDNVEYEFIILIAEDEEINYLFLEIILKDEMKLNCNILHAKNGLEAVKICENNPTIDFVLMDIKMPKMNGFEATKQIRISNPKLPIIALTAYSTSEDKEKAINAGCIDFVSKPINNEKLINRIKQHLEPLKENKHYK